jgi:hypothetical protein
VVSLRTLHEGAACFLQPEAPASAQFIPGRGELFKRVPQELLFDLQEDPWETRNLAGNPAYAAVMQEHRGLLGQWESRLQIGTRFDRN